MWAFASHFGLRSLFLIFSSLFIVSASAQGDSTIDKKRLNTLVYGYSVAYVGGFYGLNQLWYSDYPRSEFHFFNDNNEWLLMDKIGHAYSTYTLSKYSFSSFKWTGVSDSKALLYSGTSSLIFLSTIEIFDGYSDRWGFSWGDMIANSTGIALFLGQEFFLDKQWVKMKYSYSPTEYREIRPEVLGESDLQGVFKDYNGQTYWGSINLNEVYHKIKPDFLSLAFGYSASGMINSQGNYTTKNKVIITPDRSYLLSLDLDLERIDSRKKWLKAALKLLNCIKVPLPAVEISKDNAPQYHWVYF